MNAPIIELKSGRLAVETPKYDAWFRKQMNGMCAQWKEINGRKMWVFEAGYRARVNQIWIECFGEESAPPARARSVKEEFAVAMGLGLIPQQDLND